MSAIQDVAASNEIPDELKQFVMETVSKLFWRWYHEHKDNKLVKVGWWIFHKTIYLRDLHSVFEMLFGPEPAIIV
jgi:hypothetical protein